MQIMIAAFVLVVVVVGLFAMRGRAQSQPDPQEDSDYVELRRAGISMSKSGFSAIRQANRREREQFGDGRHAPYWPKHKRNGNSTLHRGVWVDDVVAKPSNRTLDQFRDEHWRTRRVVTFTLVEGEQDAPFGKGGAMIRVRATSGEPGRHSAADGSLVGYIPMVNVSPVSPSNGEWWGHSFMGTLPADMSFLVEESQAGDAVDPQATK